MSGFGFDPRRSIRGWSVRIGVIAGMVLGVLSSWGCSRTIGDACISNVECSALGDRYCDVASPGGYTDSSSARGSATHNPFAALQGLLKKP